jgi:hypothetical protein
VDGDSQTDGSEESTPSVPDTDEYSTDDNSIAGLDREVASAIKVVNRLIGVTDSELETVGPNSLKT